MIVIPYYAPYFGQQPYNFGSYGGATAAPAAPVQPAPQSSAQPGMIMGRMVTSREEAVAVPADFSGTPVVMPDFPHGKIYVKFFNVNDGTSSVVDFTAPQMAKPAATQYATMEDLEKLREEISAMRAPRVKRLKEDDE